MARILTYNVHRCLGSDGKLSPGRVAEVIAQAEPDIVALQELDVGRARTGSVDQAGKIAEALGMSHHFHAAVQVMEEKFGDAILTAKPCRLVKTGYLKGKSLIPNRDPRGALWAEIEIDGNRLQFINTHLGVTARERIAQVDMLIGPEWLGHPDCTDPIVVAGDFNALPLGRTCKLLASKLGAEETRAALDGSLATFPSRMPVLSIDHVLASPSVEIVSAEVIRTSLARLASDHLPLRVDVHIGNSMELTGRMRKKRQNLPSELG
ncbi:MAG TPA: endonuclease/exonuclease/phosphatase family protein [Micropepsaceae bacterium]|nr:endonuclease/exonuclease/phosphatase family protein [Micropepsaceae bacterium]